MDSSSITSNNRTEFLPIEQLQAKPLNRQKRSVQRNPLQGDPPHRPPTMPRPFPLHIKTLLLTPFTIPAYPQETLAQLKQRIEYLSGFPQEKLHLIHAGHVLQNPAQQQPLQLQHFELRSNAIVYLYVSPPPRTELYRRNASGELERILVSASESGPSSRIPASPGMLCGTLDVQDYYAFCLYRLAKGTQIAFTQSAPESKSNNSTMHFVISAGHGADVIPMEMKLSHDCLDKRGDNAIRKNAEERSHVDSEPLMDKSFFELLLKLSANDYMLNNGVNGG